MLEGGTGIGQEKEVDVTILNWWPGSLTERIASEWRLRAGEQASGEGGSQTEKTSAKALSWEDAQREEGPARGPEGKNMALLDQRMRLSSFVYKANSLHC